MSELKLVEKVRADQLIRWNKMEGVRVKEVQKPKEVKEVKEAKKFKEFKEVKEVREV
jgi:hypothetical protein